ncbi:alpha/beta-hydrolase [Pseudovirgaria hyperparasitica]|uniref:feruloyl esterase n=1 Tax=Pseudovirgaria hyperparasitica TaxID=470096 RepID=A0A6A6W870_9PEZI|nr:alpha/beta-hydrolase [Pseudovirgaria hyperparasitica]KAF2758843.1 alpha/beta-hydrolase [Pseudovirgaria hyperparasitica]
MRTPRHVFTAAAMLLLATLGTSTPAQQQLFPRGPSAGCGTKHASGLHTNLPFQSGGLDRTYAVYVPENYNADPSKPRKVVFDYHGRNGSGEGQYNNSQYFAYPTGNTYLGVYPSGYPGKNGEPAWQGASYAYPSINDTQFTTSLLAHIAANYCIDLSAVYASGKSNGGGFVDTLACSDAGDAFAAFAMAAAALYTDNSLNSCKGEKSGKRKRRAIMEAHGDADGTVAPGGGIGNGGTTPNITTWTGWWGVRDGCAVGDAVPGTDNKGYNTTTYSCGAGLDGVVKQYWVYGEGHCWPSAKGNTTDGTRGYCGVHVLNYTPEVIGFFERWTLANAPGN